MITIDIKLHGYKFCFRNLKANWYVISDKSV